MLRLRRDHPSDVICSLVLRSQKRKDKRMCYKVVLPHLQKSYSLEPVVVVKYSCVHSIVTTNVIRIQVLLSQLLTHTHTHTNTIPLYHAVSPRSPLVFNSNGKRVGGSRRGFINALG